MQFPVFCSGGPSGFMQERILYMWSSLQLAGAGGLQVEWAPSSDPGSRRWTTEVWLALNKDQPSTDRNLGQAHPGPLSSCWKDSTAVLEVLVTKALNRYFFLSQTAPVWPTPLRFTLSWGTPSSSSWTFLLEAGGIHFLSLVFWDFVMMWICFHPVC